MLTALKTLFFTIKKIIEQYPDDQKTISFLIATGCHHQGTSTLLKQTQMQHIHLDEEYPLDLYFNKNGIILEINENWANQSGVLLQQLFKKLNRCHRKLKISGFLFFIDINELIIPEHEEQAKILKKHTNHFLKFIDALEYTVRSGLIVTKLDQITGFTDFFSLSHELELSEPMGFSLSFAKAQARFANIFSDSWSNFVSHLNQLMIQKVHTTRANKKRILIREFPLQIALLESTFLNMLKKVTHERTHIHGIYFTSSEQKGKNINYLNQKIQNDFSLLVPISSAQSVNFKHYFIQGAIHQCQELTSYAPKPNIFQEKNTQLVLATGLLIGGYVLFQTINTHQIITKANHQLKSTSHSFEWIRDSELYALEETIVKMNHLPILFKYTDKIQLLKNYISNVEKTAYQIKFAQQIINILNNECQQTNIVKSYYALKTYKALMNKRHDQTDFIINWYAEYWGKNQTQKQVEQNKHLLKKFLWQIEWPIQKNIIMNTENILKAISPEYLAYEIISPRIIKDKQTISITGFENGQIIIPKCFLKNNYKPTEKSLINELENIKKDAWVLDDTFEKVSEEQLVSIYAKKYINWWNNLTSFTRPKQFNSFAEAQSMFRTLIKEKSFEKIINLISEQTAPNIQNPKDSFNHLIASQFSSIHFANTEDIHLQNIWKECEKFMGMFNAFNENGHASFQYLRSYFNQTQYNDALYALNDYSKRLPQPINVWINQINDNLWSLIQQSSKDYLNQIWQQNIISGFNTEIKSNYPFSNSTSEVSIEVFENYFSPNGKIQQFFREYILPFINTSQAQWNAKEIENRRFPIPETVIQKFIQANILTNMFFPNNSAHCKIQFSIEKMSLDPMVALLKLNIGSQEITDTQQENVYAQNLYWPANNAQLHIKTIDGEQYHINEQGAWGLYRLLEQINILNDPNDTSALQILLEINGNSGRYLVKTNTPINPFLPNLLKNFNLDDKLLN